jgi:hypothetical protein
LHAIKLNISWRVLLAFGLASLVLDALSNPQTVLPLALAPWTPPPGLTLAFLLLYGLHYAPLLIGVTFLANMPIYGAAAGLAAGAVGGGSVDAWAVGPGGVAAEGSGGSIRISVRSAI